MPWRFSSPGLPLNSRWWLRRRFEHAGADFSPSFLRCSARFTERRRKRHGICATQTAPCDVSAACTGECSIVSRRINGISHLRCLWFGRLSLGGGLAFPPAHRGAGGDSFNASKLVSVWLGFRLGWYQTLFY